MTTFDRQKTNVLRLGTALLLTSMAAANAQTVAFFDGFSNGNAKGWTLDNEWQIGAAVFGPAWTCSSFGDPGYDADGTPAGGVAGVNIGGNAGTNIHGNYSLTSPPIYLRPGASATLQFNRFLQSDYLPFMQNSIAVFDGVNWVTIFSPPQPFCFIDLVWQTVSYDVSAYANPAFRVRFSFQVGTAGALPSPSWTIDNVKVLLNQSQHLRFADDFSNGNSRGWTLGPAWQIGGTQPSPAWACGTVGDPTADADGVLAGGVAGVLIGGNTVSGTLQSESSLVSPIIHLTPGIETILTFDRSLKCDAPPMMNSRLAVWDGAAWHTVFAVPTGICFNDAAWSRVRYDVTAYANPDFRFKFSFDHGAASFDSPSWSIDNVRLMQNPKQPNSDAATLIVNGVGAPDESSFAETITNASGLTLVWHGPPNMPVILGGSINEGSHHNVGGLGLLDIGTGPTYSDVFIIFDGLSFPGQLFGTLDPTGTNTMYFSVSGIPIGAQFYIQGLVGQFTTGGPAPFTLTAAHLLTRS